MADDKRPYPQPCTLSSLPPIGRMDATLLVGLEEAEDGSIKAYLGARYKRLYVLVGPDHADDFRRAWGSGGHVWVYPVPPAEFIQRDAEDPR